MAVSLPVGTKPMGGDVDHSASRKAALDIARETVGTAAPNELEVFAAVEAVWLNHPGKAGRWARRGRKSPLAFGALEVTAAITPIALAVVEQVFEQLGVDLGTSWLGRMRVRIRAWRKRRQGPQAPAVDSDCVSGSNSTADATPSAISGTAPAPSSSPESALQAFTADQLTKIHELARSQAVRCGMTPDDAAFFADALVGAAVRATGFALGQRG